jgi:hypothetical protein
MKPILAVRGFVGWTRGGGSAGRCRKVLFGLEGASMTIRAGSMCQSVRSAIVAALSPDRVLRGVASGGARTSGGVGQLRIYRELTAYSDHALEEIGLRRIDLPAIARSA